MSEQTFDLMDLVLSQQVADGMPFVLLTVKSVEGEGDEGSVTVGVRFGNGIDSADDVKTFLMLALLDLPGFTAQDARDMVEELEARQRQVRTTYAAGACRTFPRPAELPEHVH